MEETKTKKDLTEFYIEKTERLINEIDVNKELNNNKKSYIIITNKKIHELFNHIKPILEDLKKIDEIKKQIEFNFKFNDLAYQIFVYKKKLINNEIIKTLMFHKKKYRLLQNLIEERENHLNNLLYQIGLSIDIIKNKKNINF